MVKASVRYSCGCGYHTVEALKAVSHCRATGHTVTVFGEVKNEDGREMRLQRQGKV